MTVKSYWNGNIYIKWINRHVQWKYMKELFDIIHMSHKIFRLIRLFFIIHVYLFIMCIYYHFKMILLAPNKKNKVHAILLDFRPYIQWIFDNILKMMRSYVYQLQRTKKISKFDCFDFFHRIAHIYIYIYMYLYIYIYVYI